MKRATGLTVARLLAMLAIVLQAFLPGSMAVAEAKGVDVSRFMCSPSGQLSPDSRAAAEQIARLLGEDVPADQPFDAHCPLCTLAHSVLAPAPLVVAAPRAFPLEQIFVRFEPGLVREAQGPPVGSRGPPSHI
ncbi:hypothetical protein PB2503_03427 [Parvularcula bermudensis HTCC2503]|uniref:DUF2946 domain-containing protein n=1 Tax=Parvularcula bermudensis (strain ATCC BAA-594 / HTCC2503 / KCTC 12087) TaxID=314260 RepID=E0TDK6_PARBH|nr:DUF2946 domain-containing protein [Parvularcula bermudensis]ADM08761.1 hypothetical protein PB2503_03427 [Parvularcula bermudensis HTCC2503]